MVKRYIYRHRLEKKDPTAAISEAVEAAVTDPTGKTRYSLGNPKQTAVIHQGLWSAHRPSDYG